MKYLWTLLFFFVALSLRASTVVTATVAVTNTAGTTNGQTITVTVGAGSPDVRTWTNAVYIEASQILTNNSQTGATENLLEQVALHPFTSVQVFQTGSTNVVLRAAKDTTLTVTLSAGWATVAYVTNTIGLGIVVRTPPDIETAAQQTNVASQLALYLNRSTNGISLSIDDTNDFSHTIFDDPGVNQVLYKRSDGLTEGSALPGTVFIPMADWFTNNLPDGVTITSASQEWITNSGLAYAFADAVTNAIRARIPMPWDWDAGAVRVEIQALCTGTNSGPGGATNVVFAVRAAANGANDAADAITFGTAVWATNHFGIGAYTNYVAIASVTVGNSPAAGKSVIWEIQRLGAQAGDTETNSDMCISEIKIHYNRIPQTAMPTATP